jgi:peptidoglycan/LPS O-acetylase OafA/YrhL
MEDGDVPRSRAGETRLQYVAGLDGLRALSVLAVMAYHFYPGHTLMPGGFLGVEVFFVISGYLITSLLLAERRRLGRVGLGHFWARRIRRLWPALIVMIVATSLVVIAFYNEDLYRLRWDMLAGLWAENWWHIFHHVDYFARNANTREPFQHLWSLAVEEQFYLVWPLEFAGVMFLLGKRWLLRVIGAQIAICWVVMAWLGTHNAVNHAYLGTETRMTGILVGCLLACFWQRRLLRGELGAKAPLVLDVAGLAALFLLFLEFLLWSQSSSGLYVWGLPFTDLLTVVLIATIVHPASSMNRWFGTTVLREIGLRSYGIYLWGIAIYEFTRPGIDWHVPGAVVWGVRAILVVGVTEASYRYLERPIRQGAIGRAWTAVHEHRDGAHGIWRRFQIGAVAGALCVASIGYAAGASTPHRNCDITGCRTQIGGGDDVIGGTIPSAPSTTGVTRKPNGPTTQPHGPTTTTFPIDASGWHTTAVGDSVMLGAADTLARVLTSAGAGPVEVNAAVSRQGDVCISVVRAFAIKHALGPLVIVHCGNNGYLATDFVDQIMAIAGPHRHVAFINDKVERPWEAANNLTLLAGVLRYPNARLIDWNWFGHHRDTTEIFYQERGGLRLHLTVRGREFYSAVVRDLLHKTWHWM